MARYAFWIVLLNLVMCIVVMAIAAWSMNNYINDGNIPGENKATLYFVLFSLIAGVVGVASCSCALENDRRGGHDMVPAATSISFVAAAFNVLAFGFTCKHINLGTGNAKLITLEVLIIILTATNKIFMAAIISTTEKETDDSRSLV